MALNITDFSFLGTGALTIASTDPTSGDARDFEYAGNVTALNLTFSRNTAPLRNYRVPGTPVYKVAPLAVEAGLTFSTTDFSLPTLRRYYGGSISTRALGAVSNEILPFNFSTGYPTPMTEDMVFNLRETNIDTGATITLKHADTLANAIGVAGTTVPPTNYIIESTGQLRIRASYLQGIAVRTSAAFWAISYSVRGNTQFAAGYSPCLERLWLRIDGRNLAECGAGLENQIVDIYKVILTPESGWDLISDDYANLSFTGQVLLDSTRPASEGQFFRVRRY